MSGPGPFYSRPGSIQTAFKPSSPVEGRVVIHAATVQLRPVRAREKQRTCNSKQRVPLPLSARSRAPPAACKYVRAFLPCGYTRSSLSPSFQLFRAPSGHSKCLPHRPAPALDCVPRPRECVCERFPLRRAAHPFQLVSGPSGHRYLPFHCRYPSARVKSAQTSPRRSAVLAPFSAVSAGRMGRVTTGCSSGAQGGKARTYLLAQKRAGHATGRRAGACGCGTVLAIADALPFSGSDRP